VLQLVRGHPLVAPLHPPPRIRFGMSVYLSPDPDRESVSLSPSPAAPHFSVVGLAAGRRGLLRSLVDL
jgi:hypothetical protein